MRNQSADRGEGNLMLLPDQDRSKGQGRMQRHKAQAWILAVQTDAQRVAKAVSDQHGHVV